MSKIISMVSCLFVGCGISLYSADTSSEESNCIKDVISEFNLQPKDKLRIIPRNYRQKMSKEVLVDLDKNDAIEGFSQDWDRIFLASEQKIDNDSLMKWAMTEKSLYGLIPGDKVQLYVKGSTKFEHKILGFYFDGSIALRQVFTEHWETKDCKFTAMTLERFKELEIIQFNPQVENNGFALNDKVYSDDEQGYISGFFRNGDVLLSKRKRIDATELRLIVFNAPPQLVKKTSSNKS